MTYQSNPLSFDLHNKIWQGVKTVDLLLSSKVHNFAHHLLLRNVINCDLSDLLLVLFS